MSQNGPRANRRRNRGVGRYSKTKQRMSKREYKAHCYTMRTSGNINGSDGSWRDWSKNPLGVSEAGFRGTTSK